MAQLEKLKRSLSRSLLRPDLAWQTFRSRLRSVDPTPPSHDPAYEAEHEAYERDGYLILDPELPPGVLDGALADLEGEHRHGDNKPFAYRDPKRIQDAWLASENVKAIARAPAVLDLLRGLYGREPLPFQTLNFRVGTEQGAHSDAYHFNSMPQGFMCGVWVALEDIDMENGPLIYYPGSQKLPEATVQAVGAQPFEEEYGRYENYVQAAIEREHLSPRFGTLRKGEALLWSSNLLHGGAPQRDPERTRLSQVTHYYFEGCRYYTPMFTDDKRVIWRNPRWVR